MVECLAYALDTLPSSALASDNFLAFSTPSGEMLATLDVLEFRNKLAQR